MFITEFRIVSLSLIAAWIESGMTNDWLFDWLAVGSGSDWWLDLVHFHHENKWFLYVPGCRQVAHKVEVPMESRTILPKQGFSKILCFSSSYGYSSLFSTQNSIPSRVVLTKSQIQLQENEMLGPEFWVSKDFWSFIYHFNYLSIDDFSFAAHCPSSTSVGHAGTNVVQFLRCSVELCKSM